MTPIRQIDAVSVALPLANVDTDQLIPARFMSRSRAEGYGTVLLHDLRFEMDGTPKPNPLDDPARAGAGILVARRNFGAGSSREAAVYALVDFGIRCVIAPSFGDIFAANAVNNGLLPARVEESTAEALIARSDTVTRIQVDLETLTIVAGGEKFPFQIDSTWRIKLLNGWDDLDLTLARSNEITVWNVRDAGLRPWVVPRRG